MTEKQPPLIAEYVDVPAMKRAADEGRVSAPVRLAGDLAGPATSEQVQRERVRRDVADRLGLPDGEAA